MSDDEYNSILEKHWKELKSKENVLSVRVGNKFVGGKDTGKKAIVVYVTKKLKTGLKPKDIIPPTIDNCPTDVIELASPDYKIGDTSVSKADPEKQRRLASGVRQ